MLRAVGAGTLFAAINAFFPLGAAREALAQAPAGGAIEKPNLKIGFIPITCATPIIMADPMGFYRRHGLNVEVIRAAGWAVIRDRAIAREFDAARDVARRGCRAAHHPGAAACLAPAGQTAFLITHDVDEAIPLADRILLMTNGPQARLAEVVVNAASPAHPRHAAPRGRRPAARLEPPRNARSPPRCLTTSHRRKRP